MHRTIFAATLLLPLFLAACDRSPSGTPKADAADKPNVLLITLDTTRADRIGCYGYDRAETPTIDALAAGGVRYANAFTHVPLTLPSHASLLTGLYPQSTGLHSNGVGSLPKDVRTMTESFHAAGYRTGAFVGAYVLDSAFGLDRGFDEYDDQLGGQDAGSSLFQERRGDRVCDAALAWLGASHDKPFFAWVHFFDPHHPYAPPQEFAERHTDPYDGELAFTDSQVRRLLTWLDENKLAEDTLVVVVGDHGEAFGEHDEVEHGLFLYQPTLHIPLILYWPGLVPAGKVVELNAGLVDVAPTVLSLVDLGPLEGQQGTQLPTAGEAMTSARNTVFSETLYPLLGFGWSPLRCIRDARWKYIEAPRPELYDLNADPAETKNVIDANPQVAEQLRASIEALMAELPQRQAGLADLSDEAMQTIRALGYVGASSEETTLDTAGLRDPKDAAHIFAGFQEARRLIQMNRAADAYPLLKKLAAQSPESEEIFADLGEACIKLRRFEEATAAFQKSLQTVPDNPRKLCRLGDAYLGLNDPQRATECYKKAVAASDEYAEAHNRLGAIALRLNQLPQARAEFERYLELCPTSAVAHANLAGILMKMGDVDSAIEHLRTSIGHDPKYLPAHRMLCQLLAKSGRRAECIAALRRADEALPRNTEFARQLAGFLIMQGRGLDAGTASEAVALAKRCCTIEPNEPENHDVLGMTLAATGDFDGAYAAATEALRLARLQNKSDFADQIAQRRQAYEQRRGGG